MSALRLPAYGREGGPPCEIGQAATLLSRLNNVRATGRGRWLALCPAHDDRTPSLSVRELDDGRILLHCFGGCAVEDILTAIGLEFDDLFPDRLPQHVYPRERRPFPTADVLRAVEFEALLVAAAASAIAKAGEALYESHDRLVELAETAINAAELTPNTQDILRLFWAELLKMGQAFRVLTDTDDRARLLVAAGRIIEAARYA